MKAKGRLYPVIQERPVSPEAETKAIDLLSLVNEKTKTGIASESSRMFLNLPKLNQRSESIDSGFRTFSSYTGSEIDTSPFNDNESMSKFCSKRSSVVTNIFVKQETAYSGEVESIPSIDNDNKSEEARHSQTSRRSLDNNMTTSGSDMSLHSISTRMEEEELQSIEDKREAEEESSNEGEDEGIVNIIPPKGWVKRIAYVFLLPLIILLFFTLPDVKKAVSQKWCYD